MQANHSLAPLNSLRRELKEGRITVQAMAENAGVRNVSIISELLRGASERKRDASDKNGAIQVSEGRSGSRRATIYDYTDCLGLDDDDDDYCGG